MVLQPSRWKPITKSEIQEVGLRSVDSEVRSRVRRLDCISYTYIRMHVHTHTHLESGNEREANAFLGGLLSE